jgi:carboxymethylenebutenolidase
MILQEEAAVDLSTPTGPMRTYMFRPVAKGKYPAVVLFSEIFQATGPIRRFAAFIAGHGYIVAVPEVYHELEPAPTKAMLTNTAKRYRPTTAMRGRSWTTFGDLKIVLADWERSASAWAGIWLFARP